MIEWIFEALVCIMRLLFYGLFGSIIEKLFYWPGGLMLRLATLGHDPPARGIHHNRFAVVLLAAIMLASGFLMTCK